jgi:hypothetical protein
LGEFRRFREFAVLDANCGICSLVSVSVTKISTLSSTISYCD